MAKCKYPNEACANMTILNGVAYCESVPCSLKGELPERKNNMSEKEARKWIRTLKNWNSILPEAQAACEIAEKMFDEVEYYRNADISNSVETIKKIVDVIKTEQKNTSCEDTKLKSFKMIENIIMDYQLDMIMNVKRE